MVQALISLTENTNRVLQVIKAKYALHDKSEAIEFLVRKYIDFENDPELRPEFIKKITALRKENSVTVDNFAKRYNLKV